jgi:hypothetical protein
MCILTDRVQPLCVVCTRAGNHVSKAVALCESSLPRLASVPWLVHGLCIGCSAHDRNGPASGAIVHECNRSMSRAKYCQHMCTCDSLRAWITGTRMINLTQVRLASSAEDMQLCLRLGARGVCVQGISSGCMVDVYSVARVPAQRCPAVVQVSGDCASMCTCVHDTRWCCVLTVRAASAAVPAGY